MSWDHSEGRERVESFLIREFGINLDGLIADAIRAKLVERNLTYTVLDEDNPTIEFSDGRVFTRICTHKQYGDSWGNEFYSFVETGKPYELVTEGFDEDDNPKVDREVICNYSEGQEEIEDGDRADDSSVGC